MMTQKYDAIAFIDSNLGTYIPYKIKDDKETYRLIYFVPRGMTKQDILQCLDVKEPVIVEPVKKKVESNLVRFVEMFVAFLLVQTPWWLRNASLPDRPAEPSRMVAFLNFGSYPDFVYPGRPESYGFPERFDPERARIERDLPSVLTHIASRFREQPATYLRWTLIGKPEFFLSWTNIDGPEDVLIYSVLHIPLYEDPRFRALWELMLDLHWPLMLVGFAGALIVLLAPSRLGIGTQRQAAAQIVAGVFAYALIFHMIGAPLPRYGIPFRPLLYPMALLLALSVWPRRSHDAPRQPQSN